MAEALEPGEIEARLNELEKRIDRLRTLYEQYFLGIERRPPTTNAQDVYRRVLQMENTFIRNTAQKFRLRSLVQRYNSYKTYWRRIEKQIEEGTYERDIRRAKRNTDRRTGTAQHDDGPPILEIELEEIQDLSDYQRELEAMDAAGRFDSHQPSAEDKERVKQQKLAQIRAQLMGGGGDAPAPAPAAAKPAEPVGQTPERSAKLDALRDRFRQNKTSTTQPSQPRTIQRSNSSQRVIQRNTASAAKPAANDHAKAVYDKLIEAKKRCNESTSGLTYESVKRSMSQQKEQLQSSRGAKDVEFKVVIKNGKAFLKPVPK